ncbi:MAG TPA: aconitate hydratase [Clostridia bacterium]|nr:aconitate hydratase [Clostridia bacterium]
MGYTISQKIISDHLLSGDFNEGEEVGIKIDQTLTQDATGTMAYLEFEAMGIERVKTELSVAYIDHNTLQSGFENADDHKFIQSVAKKRGIVFSRPGNGICHQVHLERFGVPGKTLIGSDSHTPTCGGIGMLAIGAGGLDVAVAMGGGAYYINTPETVLISLTGKLKPWVSAKDIILEVLRVLSVKGGVDKIIEYAGDGINTLSVPERATITNMGAELGATTSIFPSDSVTKAFLKAQGREQDWIELSADEDAVYTHQYTIDLDALVPMAALPHMPDNVKAIETIEKVKVDQVCIGSCTNSSLQDMMKVASVLEGRKIHPDVSLTISPGSMQVLNMLSQNGALSKMISAGARILESACGPCIGMGQSPASGAISLRTFNRNFEGRSGTADAGIYLISPETAAVSAITGYLTDPRTFGDMPQVTLPDSFLINDNLIELPASKQEAEKLEIYYGPNIKPYPKTHALEEFIKAKIILKVGDNITTDHIMPAGAKILPYRSNIPFLSEFCFKQVKDDFAACCKAEDGGIIIGGSNYGQGSSREHAALVPLYLGIKCIITKSFARIHFANLVNAGIVPLTFVNESDYDKVEENDLLEICDIKKTITNKGKLTLNNLTNGDTYPLVSEFSDRQRNILIAGGLLNYTKNQTTQN